MRTAASEWVRSSLEDGRSFSRAVLSAHDIDSGETLVAGMAEANLMQGADLASGIGDASVITPERSGTALLRNLRHELAKSEGVLVVVVEDDLRGPNDPAVARQPDSIISEGIVFHGRGLMEFSNGDELAVFLNHSASGYPLNAFVVRARGFDELKSAMRSSLGGVAKRVEAIINCIFDCEAYCLWYPPKDSITPESPEMRVRERQ